MLKVPALYTENQLFKQVEATVMVLPTRHQAYTVSGMVNGGIKQFIGFWIGGETAGAAFSNNEQ